MQATNMEMNRTSYRSTVFRRAKILEELELKGRVTVNDLIQKLCVSSVTVRNDLTHFEKLNMLIRVRGGAIKSKYYPLEADPLVSGQQKEFLREKQKIAQAALKFIEDGDSIVLDSGSTTSEIAKNLKQFQNLTIITNALNIAGILSEYDDFNVLISGGVLRRKSLSLIGDFAGNNFKNSYCDKLFLGVDGIDTSHGLSTPNVEDVYMNSIMIEMAKKVIVVTDSRKFQRRRFAFIAQISKIHTVITDSGIMEEDRARLNNLGIELVIV